MRSLSKNRLAFLVSTSLLFFSANAFAADWSLENLWSKPAVKQAAIGTAIGAGTGVLSDRASVGKGALTGAAVGVGTGLLTQSDYFYDKPLVRNALQGAIVGTGTSYALDKSKLKGAVIGAGGGAGYHYVRKHIDRY